ncbi:MAG: hypothetical protein RIM23_20840 [Coleofasciculus sp. G3-WIS-01]|uniref:hypothetical protein n=1 Tax=Coleofasciculus sp. G3-WIS-01 TaxID=3069528 RepID=UPI003303A91E
MIAVVASVDVSIPRSYLLSSDIPTTRLSPIAWLMAKTAPLQNKRDRDIWC